MKAFKRKTCVFVLVLAILMVGSEGVRNKFEFRPTVSMIPHPEKAYRGGEDAYFSSNELMIVADGVGSWSDFGVNPAFYSRFLCTKGGELFEKNKTFYRQNLVELIADASNENTFIGSSTMVVATVYEDKLRTCYIGDSGFVIFRKRKGEYKVNFEFKEQQHGFNFPYQLAMEEYNGDDPYLAICEDHELEENDIVVMGSDGLFDNVFVTEIMNLINLNKDSDEQLATVPKKLAELAIERGKDNKFASPFAIKAKEQMLTYQGGKLDDTTVILTKIKRLPQVLNGTQKLSSQKQNMKGKELKSEIFDNGIRQKLLLDLNGVNKEGIQRQFLNQGFSVNEIEETQRYDEGNDVIENFDDYSNSYDESSSQQQGQYDNAFGWNGQPEFESNTEPEWDPSKDPAVSYTWFDFSQPQVPDNAQRPNLQFEPEYKNTIFAN